MLERKQSLTPFHVGVTMSDNERLIAQIDADLREALAEHFGLPDLSDKAEDPATGVLLTRAWVYATELYRGTQSMSSKGKADKSLRQAFPADVNDETGKAVDMNLGYCIPMVPDNMYDDPDWDGTLEPDWLHMSKEEIASTPPDEAYIGQNKIGGDLAETLTETAERATERCKLGLRTWLGILVQTGTRVNKYGKEYATYEKACGYVPRHEWPEWTAKDYLDAICLDDDELPNEALDLYERILNEVDETSRWEKNGYAFTTDGILRNIDYDIKLDATRKIRIRPPCWDPKWVLGTEKEWVTGCITDMRRIQVLLGHSLDCLASGDPIPPNTLTEQLDLEQDGPDIQVEAMVVHSTYIIDDPLDGHDWVERIPYWGGVESPAFGVWRQARRDGRFVARMKGLLNRVNWTKPTKVDMRHSEVIRSRCRRIINYCYRNKISAHSMYLVIVAIQAKLQPKMRKTKPRGDINLLAYLLDRPRLGRMEDGEQQLLNPYLPDYGGYVPLSSVRVPRKRPNTKLPSSYPQWTWVTSPRSGGSTYCVMEVDCEANVYHGGHQILPWQPTLPHSTHTSLNAGWVRNSLMVPRVEKAMRGMKWSLQYKDIGAYGPRHSGGVVLGKEWYLRAYLPNGKMASDAWQVYAKHLLTKLVKYTEELVSRRHRQWETAENYIGLLKQLAVLRGL
jgi:hypothetical protein